ncbi:unnamed protein product [Lathyrus oleraceus]
MRDQNITFVAILSLFLILLCANGEVPTQNELCDPEKCNKACMDLIKYRGYCAPNGSCQCIPRSVPPRSPKSNHLS